MKKLLLLAVFLPFISVAQNWSPVNPANQYNYRLDNDAVVTATIWQTSYTVNGTDTTFRISTTMCDTCVTLSGGPNICDTCYSRYHVPQFTGRLIRTSANGWCNLRIPNRIGINLFAALNDSWLFDSIAGVTAQVIFAGPSTVLANADSVKTLLLSTGDTVRFSKNYGLTQWPNGYGQNSYYRLAGIHGPNVGTLVPRMKNYFDFNVGDVFEYHGNGNWDAVHETDFIRKYTIQSRTQNGDTIVYGIQGLGYEHSVNVMNWQQSSYYYPITGQMTFVDSADHTGNYFNNEAIENNERVLTNSGSGYWPGGVGYPAYYRCELFVDSLNITGLRFGQMQRMFSVYPGAVPIANSDTLNPEQPFTSGNPGVAIRLQEGLGQTLAQYSSNFETYWNEELFAYVKNGDTVGVLTPDVLLDGIAVQPPVSSAIAVYPNPSPGNFTVTIPGEIPAEVLLTDLQGRTVKNFGEQTRTVSLSASALAEGVYLLQVFLPGGMQTVRIIIAH